MHTSKKKMFFFFVKKDSPFWDMSGYTYIFFHFLGDKIYTNKIYKLIVYIYRSHWSAAIQSLSNIKKIHDIKSIFKYYVMSCLLDCIQSYLNNVEYNFNNLDSNN